MGCDIHVIYEVRKAGRWKGINVRDKYLKKYPDKRFGSTSMTDKGYDEYFADPLYLGRNYDLFAVLADVRNGRGFAGVETGDGFNPIDMPRGVPKDATKEYRKLIREWEGDGHSHSWFTLAELLAYDWQQKTKHRGWVGLAGFKEFEAERRPSSWSGDVIGTGVKKVSNEELRKLIAEGKAGPDPKDPFGGYYTLVEWEETYADSMGWFLEKTIPAMRKLAKKPEDVRMVFFFDN